MQRLRLIIPAVLILSLAGFASWRHFGSRANAVPPGAIAGNGVIEATEVDVSAKIAGRVLRLDAQEGDAVVAGQLIAILDSGELQGQVDQSAGNLQAAQAAYDELAAGTRPEDKRKAQAQLQAAREVLKQAQAQLALIKAGARKELIAQLQALYQQAQAQYALVKAGPRQEVVAQLQAAYKQARAQLALVKAGPRKEDIEQLRAALRQTQVGLNNAEIELKRVQRLYAQGAVAQQRVDQATATRDTAQASVDAAQQRLSAAENGARPQEIQAAAAVAEAAAQRLQEAKRGPRPEEVQAAADAVEAARQRLAEAKNGPRPEERQQAEAQVAAAQAQVDAAQAALDLAVAGPRKETLSAAKARVEQARGTLNSSGASYKQTRIFSLSSGRVTLRNVEPGEMVTAGLPIIRVAKLDRVWIRVYVPEKAVGQIVIGQRAEVTTDAFPNRRFAGRVTEIAQQPEFTPKNVQTKDERVKLVYGIKIELDNQDDALKPGMPGDALIFVR